MATNHWKFISSFHPSLVETQKIIPSPSHLHPSPSISIHLHPLHPKVSWCSASKWMICQRNMRWSAPASSSWRLAREPGTGPATVPTRVPWSLDLGGLAPQWLEKGRIAIQLDGKCMKEVLGCFVMFYLVFPSWKMVVNLPNRAYYAHFLEDSSS